MAGGAGWSGQQPPTIQRINSGSDGGEYVLMYDIASYYVPDLAEEKLVVAAWAKTFLQNHDASF